MPSKFSERSGTASDTAIEVKETVKRFRKYFNTPEGVVYLRRRFVPHEYMRLVEWLRLRAPFNHTRV